MVFNPLQERTAVRVHLGRPIAVAVAAVGLLMGCTPPFGLGQPASRALERGVEESLSSSKSFEMKGSYSEGGVQWDIDLQIAPPQQLHVLLNGRNEPLEGIVLGDQAYYRGQQFLAHHLGADALSQNLARAAGSSWWRGTVGYVPRLTDLTTGAAFRAAFLGSAASRRTDHVSVDGVDAVELSGQRADVYIASAPPYRLLRLHMTKGVVIDGVAEGDLHYGNYDKDFGIAVPGDVIDFSNLSTLPPVYTVVSVDTSGCTSPCAVTAQLRNLGGMTGAKARSTVTFTMTDAGSGHAIGSCQATVSPDVGYNATTTVGCTIPNVSGQQNAAIVTATPDNPGRG
jgi:hypothetical protein